MSGVRVGVGLIGKTRVRVRDTVTGRVGLQ